MLSSKASLRLTLLASAIFLVACQPKADPKDSQEQQKPAVEEQKPVELTLKGETVPTKVVLPDCDGKTCPEFTVERLQSNFPFIDKILDQQILKTLGQILEIAEPDAKVKQADQKKQKLQQLRVQSKKIVLMRRFNVTPIHLLVWTMS